jgi:curli biogenesis system outer membrane secretion channel CsgG
MQEWAMKRALLLFGAVAAMALGGCMTTAQTQQAQDTCAPLGAPKGTENHEACRSRVAAVQEQAVEAKANAPQTPAPASEPTPLPAKR